MKDQEQLKIAINAAALRPLVWYANDFIRLINNCVACWYLLRFYTVLISLLCASKHRKNGAKKKVQRVRGKVCDPIQFRPKLIKSSIWHNINSFKRISNSYIFLKLIGQIMLVLIFRLNFPSNQQFTTKYFRLTMRVNAHHAMKINILMTFFLSVFFYHRIRK